MTDQDSLQEFHHVISAVAHNHAVDVLYSESPSNEEIEGLIELAHVAHWHWLKRTDKTPQNVSVAQWLDEENARMFLNQALEIAETVPNPQAKEHLLDQINRIDLST